MSEAAGTPEEMRALIIENVKKTAIGLAILFALCTAAAIFYREELSSVTHWIFGKTGFIGLFSLVLIADTFVAPLPPDAALLIIAKGGAASDAYWAIPLLGLISALAGNLGWLIGRQLSSLSFVQRVSNLGGGKQRKLVEKYGRLTVVLGALTPLPFSVTCWAAGIVGMKWSRFAPLTLLRIPRFIVYYLFIAFTGGF